MVENWEIVPVFEGGMMLEGKPLTWEIPNYAEMVNRNKVEWENIPFKGCLRFARLYCNDRLFFEFRIDPISIKSENNLVFQPGSIKLNFQFI